MVIHPSILACNIPWTKEPGGLQSMGSESDITGCWVGSNKLVEVKKKKKKSPNVGYLVNWDLM